MTSILTPAEVFPPGEYLRDELEERGWTENEFAEILGRPVQAISEILNGRKQIIPETALALGEALGTSAELWINLQAAFGHLTILDIVADEDMFGTSDGVDDAESRANEQAAELDPSGGHATAYGQTSNDDGS